jgi:hypothetical protein
MPISDSITVDLHRINPKDAGYILARRFKSAHEMGIKEVRVLFDLSAKFRRQLEKFLTNSDFVESFSHDEGPKGVTHVQLH